MTTRKLDSDDLLKLEGLIDKYSAASVARAAADIGTAKKKTRGPQTNDLAKVGIWYCVSRILRTRPKDKSVSNATRIQKLRFSSVTGGAAGISPRRMEDIYREIERRRKKEPDIQRWCDIYLSTERQLGLPDNAITILAYPVKKPRRPKRPV